MTRLLLTGLLLLCLNVVSAQRDDKARQLGEEGMAAMDRGDLQDAIKLLTKAWNANPAEYDYPLEVGRAYLLTGKANRAERILHPLQYHKAAGPEVFALLANCYDSLNRNRAKEDILREGIHRFPTTGMLYNRLAAHYVGRDSVATALAVCETGLRKAPVYPDNYFLASRIMEAKGDHLWAWWYGEVFLNISDDIVMKRGLMPMVAKSAYSVMSGQWQPVPDAMSNAVVKARELCPAFPDDRLSAQVALRSCFAQHFQGKDPLTYLLKEMERQGIMELYTMHLLSESEKDAFLRWLADNAVRYAQFSDWFYWNGLKLEQPFTRHTLTAP
jgi:tetratricopeptide (TPR) repeat protein